MASIARGTEGVGLGADSVGLSGEAVITNGVEAGSVGRGLLVAAPTGLASTVSLGTSLCTAAGAGASRPASTGRPNIARNPAARTRKAPIANERR